MIPTKEKHKEKRESLSMNFKTCVKIAVLSLISYWEKLKPSGSKFECMT